MSSERQVYVLYSVESSSRILLPKVFGQCALGPQSHQSDDCIFWAPNELLLAAFRQLIINEGGQTPLGFYNSKQ
jgi:hypothetical protein